MTDYAVLLLTQFSPLKSAPRTARDLADHTGLPLPTVGKILKHLSRDGLLKSIRGTRGGYLLTRDPRGISLAEIVRNFEGPIEITSCVGGSEICAVQSKCRTQKHWSQINQVIENTLASRSLADLQRGTL